MSAFFTNDKDTDDGVVARPKGQGWDIGPYELDQTTTSIVGQPVAAQGVALGGTATLTVVARGQAPVIYQWKKNGVNLTNGGNVSGATTRTLTLTPISAADVDTYTVEVNSASPGGPLTSTDSVLSIGAGSAPAFTTHPVGQSVSSGTTVNFTTAFTGSPTPTIQWRRNGVALTNGGNVSGATSTTLTLTSVTAANAGTYTAVATNSVASATSSGAVLAVGSNVAPAITLQPVSQSVTSGGSVNFTVAASGVPTPTIQWRKNGVPLTNGGNVSGATSTTLTLSSVAAGDAATYTAVATNSVSSATSSGAVLTVSAASVTPGITTQPVSLTLTTGNDASFSVTAFGVPSPTFQWRKDTVNLSDGGNVSGTNTATLTITGISATDAAAYSVVATNLMGSATSNSANLTVTVAAVAPVILSEPVDQIVTTGDTVALSATATGTAPITYQWQKDGANVADGSLISGATTPTLTMTGVTAADNGKYVLIANNAVGTAISREATLIVTTPPVVNVAPSILTQPESKTVFLGENTSFLVATSALPAPTYQWRKNGVDLTDGTFVTGANFQILVLSNVTLADAGSYTVMATNTLGNVTSTTATLTVVTNTLPIITTHPASQSVNTGAVVFMVGRASGIPTPTSQWQRNGVNLTNGGNISGARSNTLVLSNVTSADAANYTYVAENSLGFVVSNHAGLAINGIPAFFSQPPALNVVAAGTIVKLSVSVAGDPTPTLQWRKGSSNLANGGIISGATGPTLILAGVTAADSGNYYVDAVNNRGSASAGPFTLTVNPSNVWYQPVTTGKDTAISSVGATGNLKWQISSNDGTIWSDLANDSTYAGVTTDTLRITNATAALNSVSYRLVSVNGNETTTIKTSRLDVAPSFLSFPVGVSTDASGNLYVADTSTDTITKINSAGQVTSLAGTSGQTGTADGTGAAARFNNPSGVASAPDGSLLVTDNANGTIRSISPAGVVLTIAGSTSQRGNTNGTGTAATFSAPTGITRDTGGNYYVADSTNHTVRKIAPGAVVTTLAGNAGQSGNSDGTGTAARFNNLTRVAADQAGNIYVADTTNNLIRKVTPLGVVTTLAGLSGVSGTTDGTGNGALFNQPGGVAVDNNGYVYVADTGNSTIRRVSPEGVVLTIAGLPGIAGHKDGNGTEAWFNQPRDVCISPGGFLYVADTGNAAIRRIASDASVTTLTLSTLPDSPASTAPLPLPDAPGLPATLPAPTLPTSPTPVTPASSGGGGGGAPSLWFLAVLTLLSLARWNSKGK